MFSRVIAAFIVLTSVVFAMETGESGLFEFKALDKDVPKSNIRHCMILLQSDESYTPYKHQVQTVHLMGLLYEHYYDKLPEGKVPTFQGLIDLRLKHRGDDLTPPEHDGTPVTRENWLRRYYDSVLEKYDENNIGPMDKILADMHKSYGTANTLYAEIKALMGVTNMAEKLMNIKKVRQKRRLLTEASKNLLPFLETFGDFQLHTVIGFALSNAGEEISLQGALGKASNMLKNQPDMFIAKADFGPFMGYVWNRLAFAYESARSADNDKGGQ